MVALCLRKLSRAFAKRAIPREHRLEQLQPWRQRILIIRKKGHSVSSGSRYQRLTVEETGGKGIFTDTRRQVRLNIFCFPPFCCVSISVCATEQACKGRMWMCKSKTRSKTRASEKRILQSNQASLEKECFLKDSSHVRTCSSRYRFLDRNLHTHRTASYK